MTLIWRSGWTPAGKGPTRERRFTGGPPFGHSAKKRHIRFSQPAAPDCIIGVSGAVLSVGTWVSSAQGENMMVDCCFYSPADIWFVGSGSSWHVFLFWGEGGGSCCSMGRRSWCWTICLACDKWYESSDQESTSELNNTRQLFCVETLCLQQKLLHFERQNPKTLIMCLRFLFTTTGTLCRSVVTYK